MKAPATFPDEIHCHGCTLVATEPSVEAARRHGWRVAWTPQQPSWCPTCWNGEKMTRPKPGTAQPYDEPLF